MRTRALSDRADLEPGRCRGRYDTIDRREFRGDSQGEFPRRSPAFLKPLMDRVGPMKTNHPLKKVMAGQLL